MHSGDSLRLDVGDLETPLGVVVAVLADAAGTRCRDHADAAPRAVADLEDVVAAWRIAARVALGADGPGVLVLDLGPPGFELPDGPAARLRAGRAARSR